MNERIALVTGAARGIGAAIADRLARDGATVMGLDVRDEVVARATSWGPRARGIVVDLVDEEAVVAAVDRIRLDVGSISILVNNAALTAVHRPWDSVTMSDWDRVMAVNLRSAFLCSKICAPQMRSLGWGRIVNISSVTYLTGQQHLVDYVSSKGGIVGLTRALSRELGADGITVNAISPGSIRTEVDEQNFPDQEAILEQQKLVQAIPRRGEPSDIAAAVAFFASDDASFITGQLLNVDGGWVMH